MTKQPEVLLTCQCWSNIMYDPSIGGGGSNSSGGNSSRTSAGSAFFCFSNLAFSRLSSVYRVKNDGGSGHALPDLFCSVMAMRAGVYYSILVK